MSSSLHSLSLQQQFGPILDVEIIFNERGSKVCTPDLVDSTVCRHCTPHTTHIDTTRMPFLTEKSIHFEHYIRLLDNEFRFDSLLALYLRNSFLYA